MILWKGTGKIRLLYIREGLLKLNLKSYSIGSDFDPLKSFKAGSRKYLVPLLLLLSRINLCNLFKSTKPYLLFPLC